jgi:hypothetical protein
MEHVDIVPPEKVAFIAYNIGSIRISSEVWRLDN